MERPLRQPAPPAESPSTNTSLVPSLEKDGTIITALPSPQVLAVSAVAFTGAVPGTLDSRQMTYGSPVPLSPRPDVGPSPEAPVSPVGKRRRVGTKS